MTTATFLEPAERRFVLYNVGWDGYETLVKLVDGHGVKLSYSKGNVELMSPLYPHERDGKLIGFAIETIAEELSIPCNATGSTTFRSHAAARGLEPDQCYYVANAGRIQGMVRFDPETYPPPDLAVEIELTHSMLDKLDIYAGLNIPEVWRYDGEILSVFLLQADGSYAESRTSASFPFLPMAEVVRFVQEFDVTREILCRREFRAWVREVLAPMRDRWLQGEV